MVSRNSDQPVVVCLDDDPQVLNAVQRLLRREPYELLTTDKPETALRWLVEGGVRLLITDLRMPEMDGRDLIKVVEERFPGTASLILTGYPDQAPTQSRPRLITKPWDDRELKETIRTLVRQPPTPRDPVRLAPKGSLLIVAEDDRVRRQAAAAALAESFKVQGTADVDEALNLLRQTQPPVELVVVDSKVPIRPLRDALPDATFVAIAETPSSDEVGYWYDLGVEQVLKLPVSPAALAAIFRRCVLRVRARRRDAGREAWHAAHHAAEPWPTRARRTLVGWIQAPSRSRTGERRTLLAMSAAAVLIGILLAITWRTLQRIPPLDFAGGGRDPLERFWRMSTEDQALRRWYMMQQLDLNREMQEETRRFHELQLRPTPPAPAPPDRSEVRESKQR